MQNLFRFLILSVSDTVIAVLIIIPSIALAIFFFVILPILIVNQIYEDFVKKHSNAYKKLLTINKKYTFLNVPNFDMSHSYDNEHFYNNISNEDYLIYQLVYIKKKVSLAIDTANKNKEQYDLYRKEIASNCFYNDFDIDKVLKNKSKLLNMEKKIINKNFLKTCIELKIEVTLRLTDINGNYKRSKNREFSTKQIKAIMYKLNKKRGNRYLNEDIWNSICRVERGKVTNKLRFAIYKRDNYRCQKCGRRFKNGHELEIDHIYPISKGGKSTYDNLQCLCHKCNKEKGARIDF